MKGLRLLFAVAIGLFITCLFSSTSAWAQSSNDIIIAPHYIEQKIKEAKAGKLDYEFASWVVQAAENAFLQASKNPTAEDWWDSALEKYEIAYILYEEGKAEPIYLAATAIRLGTIHIHNNILNRAEQLLRKGVALLEDYKPATNVKLIKREYIFGLGYLGRVYRLQDRTELAKETLSKALSFAKKYFGDDSPEVKALMSHMR
ncbi:MAG: hypothetical protein GY797_38325 [Deltaproteobacteria bacterium]|nr:hypothetical protein [Deltaproteobacteria bacterium]